MPVELNLPGLRKDGRVRSPARGGVWSPLDQLNDLAGALVVEAASMPLRDIKSVPHTWGHVIVFETALLDERHPGHRDAKEQWRALLATLALRNRPGFSVQARPVALGRPGEAGEVDRFAKVAAREKLKPRIQETCTWDPVHLLYAEPPDRSPEDPGVLIGILSPSTIVGPARDFAGDERLNQFWARNGLREPLSGAPDTDRLLSPDQLEVCRLFAMHLRDTIRGLAEPCDSAAVNTLVGLLEEFAGDLDRSGARHHNATWKPRVLGDLVAQSPGGLYEAVNTVWEPDPKASDITDLKVGELDIDEKTTLKIVLADPECAHTLRRRPEYISLFGQRTLADLPGSSGDGAPVRIPEHLRREAARSHILLLGPGDLLADRLTELEEFTTPAHPEAFRDRLLPVKAAALLLFPGVADLAACIDRRGSAPRPLVGLRVTLTDRRNHHHDHVVAREYGQDGIEKANAPEALAAWPDFRPPTVHDDAGREVAGWKWNYLFTSTNVSRSPSERSVIVTTGISRDLLERDLMRTTFGQGPERVDYCRKRLESWSSEDGPWEGESGVRCDEGKPNEERNWFEWLRLRNDGGQNPREKHLQRSESAFEAALFRLPSAHGAVYAGLGILPPARDVQTQDAAAGGTARIAIDFGTSNTIVYCKRGEGKIEPLPFTPRLRRFNDHRDSDGAHAERQAEYTAFMPSRKVQQPFATVMQIRGAEGGADLAAVWREAGEPALWRDYAFFDPDVLHLTENLLSGRGRSNLLFDLKWGTEPEERMRMGRYLRHIAILSLAEVVGHRHLPAPSSVTWHCSYPIMVPSADAYRRVIGSAARNERDNWADVVFHTESHAALDYFREVERAQPQAMLVFDVGGGSTDIALAVRGSGVWQHSLRLAGDDLMTEFLLYNRRVLEVLDLSHIGRRGVFGDRRSRDAFMQPPGDQPPSDSDRKAAKAIINSPVFGEVFEKSWFNVRDAEAMKLLKVGASVMMGGLCAMLGIQIRALLRVEPAPLAPADLTSIRLCFGGRGSTLFKLWQDDETFEGLRGYLSEHAAADLGLEAPPEVTPYFSRDMKHEVAKGMLARRRDEAPFPSTNPSVLGIGARLDQDIIDAAAFMDDLKGKHRDGVAASVAWEEFSAFLERVGAQCGFGLSVGRAARDDITAEGVSAFTDLLRVPLLPSAVPPAADLGAVTAQRRSPAEDQEEGDNAAPHATRGRRTVVAELEPPFIVMLKKTLSLLYEGKGIQVSWDLPRDR